MKHNLEKYALAAGAVFLGLETGQATVIYTDIVPDAIANSTDSYTLNIKSADRYNLNISTLSNFNLINITNNSANASAIGQPIKIYNLAVSESIDASDNWVKPDNTYAIYNLGAVNATSVAYYGSFVDSRGFIGLRFSDSGLTNYGWVQIAVNAAGSKIKIFDYAYESEPNTPILTAIVPEPAGLALLALGAAGIFASRKKL